jgi:hypothetical protein
MSRCSPGLCIAQFGLCALLLCLLLGSLAFLVSLFDGLEAVAWMQDVVFCLADIAHTLVVSANVWTLVAPHLRDGFGDFCLGPARSAWRGWWQFSELV